MLQSISWQTYFEIIGLALITYYVTITFLFYRQDIVLKIHRIQSPKQPFEIEKENNLLQPHPHEQYFDEDIIDTNHTSVLADTFNEELQAFTESTSDRYSKPQLIAGLKKLLKKYSVLKDDSFQTSINTAIVNECMNNCSISLTEEEVSALWSD